VHYFALVNAIDIFMFFSQIAPLI